MHPVNYKNPRLYTLQQKRQLIWNLQKEYHSWQESVGVKGTLYSDTDAQGEIINSLSQLRLDLNISLGKVSDGFLREKKFELITLEKKLINNFLQDVDNLILNMRNGDIDEENLIEHLKLAANLSAKAYGLNRYMNLYSFENEAIQQGIEYTDKIKGKFHPDNEWAPRPIVVLLRSFKSDDPVSRPLAMNFSSSLDEIKSEIRIRKYLLQRLNNYKSASKKEKAKPKSAKVKTDLDELKVQYAKELQRYESRLYQMYLLRTLDLLAMGPSIEDKEVLEQFYLKCIRKYRACVFTKNWTESKHKAIRTSPYDQDRRICPREFELRFKLINQGYRVDVDLDAGSIVERVEKLFTEVDENGKTALERNPHAAGLLSEELGLIVAATGRRDLLQKFWKFLGSKIGYGAESIHGRRLNPSEEIMIASAIRPNMDESLEESKEILSLANQFRHFLVMSMENDEAQEVLNDLGLEGIDSYFVIAKGKENGATLAQGPKNLEAFREIVSATRDYEKERTVIRLLGEYMNNTIFKQEANKYLIKMINQKAFDEDDLQRKSSTAVASAFLNHFIGTFKRDEALFYKFVRVVMLASTTLGVGTLAAATIVIAISSVTAAGFLPIAGATAGALMTVLALVGAGFGIWHSGNALLNLWVDRKRTANERLIRTLQQRTIPRFINEVGTFGYYGFKFEKPQLNREEKKKVSELVKEWEKGLRDRMGEIEGTRRNNVLEHLYEYRKFLYDKLETAENQKIAKAAVLEIDRNKRWLKKHLETIKDDILEPFQDWSAVTPTLDGLKEKLRVLGFAKTDEQVLVEQVINLIANAG